MMQYWGQEDTSVHFCEKNYEQVWWAAEFFNTISSVFYVLVGAFFLGSRLDHLGKGIIGVGIGAVILHMTMRYYGQWIDEIAMIILCFLSAKTVKPTISNYLLVFILFLYGLLNQYFAYFFAVFTLAQFYILYYNLKQNNRIKKICIMGYIVFFILGSSCWMADQLLCDLVQPYQLHAWWHFFTAFGTMFGFLAMYPTHID
jgi:dihydroceramidase